MGKMFLTSFSLACLLGTATVTLAAEPGTEDPNNWPQYHRTSNAWRYSPLDQINKANVRTLQLVWSRAMEPGINQATPLVYNGVMYVTNARASVAIDAATIF